jgi:hypothetical protein
MNDRRTWYHKELVVLLAEAKALHLLPTKHGAWKPDKDKDKEDHT